MAAVLRQIHAVHIDLAVLGVVVLQQQLGNGGFAAAAAAHQRHLFAGGDGKADMIQCRGTVAVAEGDVLELDVALHLFHLALLHTLGSLVLSGVVHDLGQTLHGDAGFLDLHLQADQVAQGGGKVAGQGAECHKAAQRHLAVQHLTDAHIGGQHTEAGGDEGGDQTLRGADAAGAQADLQALHVLAFQIIQLGLLVGVALDGLDAAQALDHLAVQRGRLCHALFVDLFIGLLVHQHQQNADQRHEQRDGEQHGVHAEQDDAGDDSHGDIHHKAQRNAGKDGFDGVCVRVTGGDITGLAGGKELHGQVEDVPEVAQHQRDIDLDGQMDQHPLAHKADQRAGDADHAEHQDQGDQKVIQPVGQHLVHQDLIEHGGRDAQNGGDHRAEDGVEEQLFLGQKQVDIPLHHAVLAALAVLTVLAVFTVPAAKLAALELGGGVQQQQHAGKVLIELVQTDLFQLRAGVADDDVILALMLFALFLFFLAGLGVLQHMLAARAFVLDGGLFEHHNKVSQTLIGDHLCNTGKREVAQEVFAVHADCGGGKAKFIGGFLQADKVSAFQVGTHHIPQAGDGHFLFVVQAHHGQTGSRTVGGIVLPDVGITHRCFLLFYRFIQTTQSRPAARACRTEPPACLLI